MGTEDSAIKTEESDLDHGDGERVSNDAAHEQLKTVSVILSKDKKP